MQTPLSDYGVKALILFSFVERQSEFAFFGALTAVDAPFVFLFDFWGDDKLMKILFQI